MLRTGDFGYLDPDGYLYFEGRRDDIFKHNGARMNSQEIEAAAQQVPGVELAALLIPSRDDEPMVLVVSGDSIDPPSVLSAMSRHLEQVKTPEICVVVPEMPMTPNGKVDKTKLRESRATHHPLGGESDDDSGQRIYPVRRAGRPPVRATAAITAPVPQGQPHRSLARVNGGTVLDPQHLYRAFTSALPGDRRIAAPDRGAGG
ncbi:hypothetical protein [Plantactinospora veratri]